MIFGYPNDRSIIARTVADRPGKVQVVTDGMRVTRTMVYGSEETGLSSS
jgi:hypothetical protein